MLVAICSPRNPCNAAAPDGEATRFLGLRLDAALERLRDEGLNILFSSEFVPPTLVVASEPVGKSREEILDSLLAPHGLASARGPGGVRLVVRAKRRGAIRGLARNATTATPLPGVRVQVLATSIAAVTDGDGRFTLEQVPDGAHAVEAHVPGFASARIERVPVVAGRTTELRLDLTPVHLAPEEVTVRARGEWPPHGAPVTHTVLDGAAIQGRPEVASDLMRAIEDLPGFTGREESAAVSVRGGLDDEAMVLLDGLELYDPFHLRDYQNFISMVDARTVESATVISDIFPAEYGGRLSGVIEIDTRRPEGHGGLFAVGSEDLYAQGYGGYRGGRGHWLVAARAGFPGEQAEGVTADTGLTTNYQDLLAKTSYQVTGRTTVDLNLFGAFDRVKKREAVNGGFSSKDVDRYAWVALRNIWGPGLLSRTTVARGRLEHERRGEDDGSAVRDDRETEILGVKQDWAWEVGRHLVKWGGDLQHLMARYRYRSVVPDLEDPKTLVTNVVDLDPSGTNIALYAADRFRVLPVLDVELGLRWEHQDYIDNVDRHLAPRVGLAWRPGERNAVRLAWGTVFQPKRIHELQVEDGATTFSRPSKAEHASLRYEHRIGNGIHLGLGVYRKRISRLEPRYENLFQSLSLFPEVSAYRVLVAPDDARARGFEMRVDSGDAAEGPAWWASYARARAEDRIDGRYEARSSDQRHDLGTGVGIELGRWGLGLTGRYRSGRPTTPVTAEEMVLAGGAMGFEVVAGSRNSERLPFELRFDFRVDRGWTIGRGRLDAYATVINLANRDNVCCIDDFDVNPLPDGGADAVPQKRVPLNRELRVGISWTF